MDECAGIRKPRYTAITAVAPNAIHLDTRRARASRSQRHSGQSSVHASPGTRFPHLAHGTSGNPLSDGITELLGAGVPAEIAGTNLLYDDDVLDRLPDALGPVQLAHVIEHHRGGQHLSRGISDPLPRDI